MGQTAIELNAHEKTRLCTAALERSEDESLISHRVEKIRELAGAASSDPFVFTSSGAEAVNQVLWSVFLEIARKEGKCHFVASAIEDAPTMQMLKRLEELGCYVKIAPVNAKGEIDSAKLRELINPRTALVSLTMAHGLTGVIQPVEEIAQAVKEKGALLHLDASYAMGKYHFSFAEIGADYLTFSGHLIHGPLGSGGLFAKKAAPLVPLILGGGGLRGGVEDTPTLLSLGSAAHQASLFLDHMSLEVARLRDFFEKEILRLVPGAVLLYKDSLRLPNTAAISFPRAHAEAIHYLLERKNLFASIGGSYSQHLHRLVPDGECAVSFSLSRMTTEAEVRAAVQIIAETVQTLCKVSEGVFDV